MRISKNLLIALCTVSVMVGCVTVTERAEKIQVHSQMGTLLSGCKKLGPVSAKAQAAMRPLPSIIEQAKYDARDRAADMGADTLVITNIDTAMHFLRGWEATAQGVALRCY